MNRYAGGLWGLLIGDALGVPYEFNPPDNLPPMEQLEMTPPHGFRKTYSGVPEGTCQMTEPKHFVCWKVYWIVTNWN